jgi:hypothetical protein
MKTTLIKSCSSVLLFSFFLFSCHEETTIENENTTDTIVVKPDSKTDEYIKAGKELIEVGKDISSNKKYKDSVRTANKKPVWVYQLGPAFDDEDLAGAAIEKLKTISNISVFKQGRREFYIIKDDGISTEELLEENYGDIKKQVAALSNYTVQKCNLSIKCSSKTNPTITKNMHYKFQKEKKEVECRTCE